jgi:type II secretion system protein C
LPLQLVSTLPGRNASEGTALLGPDATNPQTYAAGALLENGARLVEIHPDRVVLERGGKRALLHLDGESPADGTRSAGISARSAGSELTTVGGRTPTVIARASSVDSISEVIRAQPAYDSDGLTAGLEVYPGRRVGAFTQLGLKPGDLIQFVNGQRISSDTQWREIERALTDGAVIDVGVTREGQLLHLALDGLVLAGGKQANEGAVSVDVPPGVPPL